MPYTMRHCTITSGYGRCRRQSKHPRVSVLIKIAYIDTEGRAILTSIDNQEHSVLSESKALPPAMVSTENKPWRIFLSERR